MEMTIIKHNLQDTSDHSALSLTVVFIITIIVTGIFFSFFALSITRPLNGTVEMANSLRQGRVSARLNLGNRSD